MDKVRIDKWLWAARFFKTRTLAKTAIEGGKIQYNGQRCKANKMVEVDALVTIRIGHVTREVKVCGLSDQRKGAPIAQTLYAETEESKEKREIESWQRKQLQAATLPPPRRPTKKDRRLIHKFKEQQS